MKKESYNLRRLLDILTESDIPIEQCNDIIIGYVKATSLIRQNCNSKDSEEIVDKLDKVVTALTPYPNVAINLLELIKMIILP